MLENKHESGKQMGRIYGVIFPVNIHRQRRPSTILQLLQIYNKTLNKNVSLSSTHFNSFSCLLNYINSKNLLSLKKGGWDSTGEKVGVSLEEEKYQTYSMRTGAEKMGQEAIRGE